jgi:lipopolysaccharide biosynthesis glycosyltransferase
MKKTLDLFFCVDSGFSMGFFTTIVPLLEHFSEEVTPIINVLDSGLDDHFLENLRVFIDEHPKKPVLKLKKLPKELMEPFEEQTYYLNKQLLRVSTLSKIALPLIYPDCDFGIYLDCDIYVQKDFAELLKYEGGDSYFYAVQDRFIKTIDSPIEDIDCELYGMDPKAGYFNGGFFIMNLKGFDRGTYWNQIKEISRKGKLKWEDQSLLNLTLCKEWKPIDDSWNKMIPPEHVEYSFPKKDINYHFFGGQKPWNFSPSLSLGLVPKFYETLRNNPIDGFEHPTVNRPYGLWWIKNFATSLFSRQTEDGSQNPA